MQHTFGYGNSSSNTTTMKKILLLVILSVSVALSLRSQTIVPDGVMHKLIASQTLVRDTNFYLNTPFTYDWSVSVPWTCTGTQSSSIKIQCLAGDRWTNYALDSCSIATSPGLCSWEDYMCNYARLRVHIRVTSGNSLSISGVWYRFIKKSNP